MDGETETEKAEVNLHREEVAESELNLAYLATEMR